MSDSKGQIEKHTDEEEREVLLVMDDVLRVLETELSEKRAGRWHYALVVCPNFDEGDAVYRMGSSFTDNVLAVFLKAVSNMIARQYPWQRRPIPKKEPS